MSGIGVDETGGCTNLGGNPQVFRDTPVAHPKKQHIPWAVRSVATGDKPPPRRVPQGFPPAGFRPVCRVGRYRLRLGSVKVPPDAPQQAKAIGTRPGNTALVAVGRSYPGAGHIHHLDRML